VLYTTTFIWQFAVLFLRFVDGICFNWPIRMQKLSKLQKKRGCKIKSKSKTSFKNDGRDLWQQHTSFFLQIKNTSPQHTSVPSADLNQTVKK